MNETSVQIIHLPNNSERTVYTPVNPQYEARLITPPFYLHNNFRTS